MQHRYPYDPALLAQVFDALCGEKLLHRTISFDEPLRKNLYRKLRETLQPPTARSGFRICDIVEGDDRLVVAPQSKFERQYNVPAGQTWVLYQYTPEEHALSQGSMAILCFSNAQRLKFLGYTPLLCYDHALPRDFLGKVADDDALYTPAPAKY